MLYAVIKTFHIRQNKRKERRNRKLEGREGGEVPIGRERERERPVPLPSPTGHNLTLSRKSAADELKHFTSSPADEEKKER